MAMMKPLFKRDYLMEIVHRANKLAESYLKAKKLGTKVGLNTITISLKSFVENLRRFGYFRVTHTFLDKPNGEILETEYDYSPPKEEKYRFLVERFVSNSHFYYTFSYKENGNWIAILEYDSPAKLLVKMAQIILKQEGKDHSILKFNPEDFN